MIFLTGFCPYVPPPNRFSSPIIPKQNRSHRSNVVCDGSKLRIYLEKNLT